GGASSGGKTSQGGNPSTGGASGGEGGSNPVQGGSAGSEPMTGGAGGWSSSEGGAGGMAGGGGEGGVPVEQITSDGYSIGAFAPLANYTGISGQALIARKRGGGTHVSVQVIGLQPSAQYPVHVHAAPCSQSAGGGHYKRDPSVTTTSEANELWVPVTTDANGVGIGWLDVPTHEARGDALSVVVHDPNATDTPKMACADLSIQSATPLQASGKFGSFAQATTVDTPIAGTAWLVRNTASTLVSFDVKGLDPAAMYSAHIHALPCAVTAAGGHYKIDTTITATQETNELWVPLGDTSTGSASGSLNFAHAARSDAQSMVIHRMDGANALKVACADLAVSVYPPLRMAGVAVPFPAATDLGYPSLAATAAMTREQDQSMRFELTVSGLAEHSVYPTHVHNLPCALQSGGGHYKIDPTIAATEQSNEIWLNFTAGHEGGGSFRTRGSTLLRADARSIVIHDSATAATRLACIDLAP
ncbi:MAG TPA: hypothetical protein VFQ35_16780, partial [Polyangiaceae bacterium]|nr:hypothetical protein [Polyangiaceae bacterium]